MTSKQGSRASAQIKVEEGEELRRVRGRLAVIMEEMVELLDEIDGDADLEEEQDVGVEDLPHDSRDEGNDEPSAD